MTGTSSMKILAAALLLAHASGCARKGPPLPPPTHEGERQPPTTPSRPTPATTLGNDGPFVYRGVPAGATSADSPPPVPSKGMPYSGPAEDILLRSPLTPFLEFKVEGYFRSCFDHFTVEAKAPAGWLPVKSTLPNKGQYVLNGKQVGYGMCDVVSCLRIEHPLRIPLVEIVEASSAPANPKGWPSFESRPLHGEVRVRYPYFANDSCTSERVAEHIVLL
jgi:hypothetical protein